MTEPAMQIKVGVNLDDLDRDFKTLAKKVADAPKKLTVDVKSDGADRATKSVTTLSEQVSKMQMQIEAQARQQMQMNQMYDLGRQQLDLYNRAMGAQGAIVQRQMAANDNLAGSHSHLTDALRIGTKTAIDYAASWLATAGAVGAGVLVFGGLLAILGPIILAYKLVTTAIGFATDAWRLGGEELDRYRKIAEDAAKVDLSTTYFQKLKQGAADSKASVDDLTKAMMTLQKQSADQLGGSPLQNRLSASVKAGNFAGNTGVGDFAAANTTEEKFKSIVFLIHQAMDAGQRLAAIDIAGTAFGPEAADNLRKNAAYFDQMTAAAAKVSDKQIVSEADVSRALDLQTRYDAAVKILETRWHPIQNLLTQAGIEFHANWVSTVETIANGVDWATKLVSKLEGVPSWFQKKLNEGSQWVIDNTTTPESRAGAEKQYGLTSDPTEMARGTDAYGKAVDALRVGLQNQYTVQQKVNETNTVAQKAAGDTSHAIDTQTKAVAEQANAYQRAQDSIEKHIARMNADKDAVGLGVGALEELRAKATLLTAAQQAGIPVTAEMSAQIDALAKKAGTAGLELAKLRINDQIKFDRATIGLSQEDVQIAQQLRSIYPDVTEAINSSEAAQMRLNNELRQAKEIANGFGQDLLSGLLRGEGAMKSMTSAASNLIAKLSSAQLDKFMSGKFEGGNNLGSVGGIATIAGAGLAGYQSGNSMTGALGGAMSGFMVGGIPGALLGGAAGSITGPLVSDQKRKSGANDNEPAVEPERKAA